MKTTIFITLMFIYSLGINAQIQTGVWRTSSTNTDYHHLTRNGGGAAVYINQLSNESNKPILRLSSGEFEANKGVKFTVENDGSVGIGTTSIGSHKLAVEGTISSSTIFATSFRSKTENSNYHHFTRNGGGAAVYINQLSNESNKPILRLSSGSSDANQNVKFTVENNGSVGIGTTTIGSHKLAVEGSIGAREVIVEVGTWSDFVFEKDYQLPSLKEVENHIKEKGHLQDIPNTKEVEKNGINLGTMDAKLLQKIEELTLYTIEQEKKITSQNRIINQQQKEIEKLKQLSSRLTKIENLLNQ